MKKEKSRFQKNFFFISYELNSYKKLKKQFKKTFQNNYKAK